MNKLMHNISNAIDDAISKKIDIINLSYNGELMNEEEKNAIKRAEKAGIIVVISAGNNHLELTKNKCNSYPACYSLELNNIIVVGNITKSNELNEESNFGEVVDVYFNGTNIPSLAINDGFFSLSGTSMSSPFIAGIISQIMSQSKRKLSISDIKKALVTNIKPSIDFKSKVLNYKQSIRTISSQK
jgi:minor extracellular protease Epr